MEKINLSFNSVKDAYGKIGDVLRKVPWILGRHAFMCIIVCFVLAVCLGEFLFYNDVYLAKVADPESITMPIRFNEQAYQSVIQEWQARQSLFTRAGQQSYTNPFSK